MGIVSRSQGGAGGGATILFTSTLAAPAASIDTGAGGIAGGLNILEVVMLLRTDEVGPNVGVLVTLNNDGGANYDWQRVEGSNVTAAAAIGVAQTAWTVRAHGNGGSAAYPGAVVITIPGYAATAFNKVGSAVGTVPDATAANNTADEYSLGWRNTAAITRLKVASTGNFVAGSQLLIYGR